MCAVITLTLIGLVGVLVTLSFCIHQGYFSSNNEDVVYGPGDSQKVEFSALFCEELVPDSNNYSYSRNLEASTLYLLDKDPELSGETNITFQDEFLIFDKIKQLNFHFFPKSLITFEACIDNNTYSSVGDFYLVKGRSIYDDWYNSGEKSPPSSIASLQVREFCSQGKQNFKYQVTEEDQYYFLFINDKQIYPQITAMVVSYDIKRVIYDVDQNAIKNSCTFTGTSRCSLNVPLQSSASAVLMYGTPIDWENEWENNSISVNCSPRIWLYVLISVISMLAIAICTSCVCILACCCHRCRFRSKDELEKPLLGQHTTHLYNEKAEEEEPTNPYDRPNTNSHIAFQPSNNPYPPPNFKQQPEFNFMMGTPTYDTFK